MPTPKFANLKRILAEESDPERGVVTERAEGRVENEIRAAAVDFFERFFLWSAKTRPVEGSRGIRTVTVLTLFGKADVARRYVTGDGGAGPGFAGCAGRCTMACERVLAAMGCDLSSYARAESVARARGIDVSESKIREITTRHGREACGRTPPPDVDIFPSRACGGKRRFTAVTMVISTDGTCVPCAKRDLEGVKGRDGEAKGRNIDVGMVGVYNSVRREDNRPVIPASSRIYLVGADADEIGTRLHGAAWAAGYGRVERVQFIGDGAEWIEKIARTRFPSALFTLDCSHALGYVYKVCTYLAGSEKEAKAVFRKVKDRMYEHGFERAEKYLRNKYREHFTEEGLGRWTDEAANAWRYLDARRAYMNYGWLRRHGYLIGSGHIESACKVIIGQRCKGPGMHWGYENALAVSTLRAEMRSAKKF